LTRRAVSQSPCAVVVRDAPARDIPSVAPGGFRRLPNLGVEATSEKNLIRTGNGGGGGGGGGSGGSGGGGGGNGYGLTRLVGTDG
jgi:hypothetical protein